VLSIVEISRRPTAADTQSVLQKMQAVRDEIAKGAKFEDVAKRESEDTSSAVRGGDLGKSVKGRFVKAFEDAAFKLGKGELSQVVKTDYGFHVIKLDDKKGDTIWVRHVLKLVHQSDSAATATDRKADQVAKIAAGSDIAAKFDTAAKSLGLLTSRIEVREGDVASYLGHAVPSASAWAFGGAKIGESSDLFDDDQAYFLVRLDSLTPGGVQQLAAVQDEVREAVARERALDALVPKAQVLATAAAASSLETAAKAQGLTVTKAGPFSRNTTVLELGAVSEAVGAAFGLPVGTTSAPIRTEAAVYVLRPDRRVDADQKAWEIQKAAQRQQVTRGMRDQRVRLFLDGLHKAAKIDDRRKQIQAAQRRQTVS
jgi:peptidyl-prolyl cis-trans isomerase D